MDPISPELSNSELGQDQGPTDPEERQRYEEELRNELSKVSSSADVFAKHMLDHYGRLIFINSTKSSLLD